MEFEVTMRCTVTKVVTVQCDDEQQARANPWDFAFDEIETEQSDWDVTGVKCTEIL